MTSLIDTIKPNQKTLALFFDLLSVLGGSLFIALLSQVSFPLGFTPVPLTLQSFAILLIGALLGSRRGALAVLTYIVEGILGLPVFAGGCYGCAQIFGPTGGYLVGFILAAWCVGRLLESGWKVSFGKTLLAMCMGSFVIFLIGMLVLSCYVGGYKNAFILGVLPFLLGDLFKAMVAAIVVPCGWKFVRSFQ